MNRRTRTASPFRSSFRPALRQRGASLLEVIAYLGIAAIVVLGAVSMLGSAFSNAQANRTVEEVVSIRTGVKRLYMGQSASYGDQDITVQASKAGILPATLSPTAAGATNAWNGTVNIVGNVSSFKIVYANVPDSACIAILSGASGWTSIGTTSTATPIVDFPVKPADAQTACVGTNNANTITWIAS